MKKNTLYLLVLGLVMILQSQSIQAMRVLTFDDIRDNEGGFDSKTLVDVTQISPSGSKLTDEEKSKLTKNPHLTSLKTLKLQDQDLDDDFVEILCENKSLGRIITLDVSNNIKITNASVTSILKSKILGSIRDLPQISGSLGIPSSTIYLTASGTGIKPTDPQQSYFYKCVKDFTISYRHPVSNEETSGTTENSAKFVEVTL